MPVDPEALHRRGLISDRAMDRLRETMTHQAEAAPDATARAVRGITDTARSFARGGLQGVANDRGIDTPAWSKRAGEVLTSEGANAALGTIYPAYKGANAFIGGATKSGSGRVLAEEPKRYLMKDVPFKDNSFFSSDPKVASRFAEGLSEEPSVFPVDIDFKNPKVIDGRGKPAASWQFETIAKRHDMMDEFKQYHDALADPKYDGVIVTNTADEGHVYIPKSGGQVSPKFKGGSE